MIKKRALFFAVFLMFLIVPSAYSLTTKSIFSGTQADGTTATASNGIPLTFRVMYDLRIVDIDYGTGSVSLGEDSCKEKDDYKFCVVGTLQFSHLDPETKAHVYKAAITIEHTITTVTLARNIEKTTIPIDDSANVKATIKNTGDTTAANINFEDSFSEAFLVSGVSGCVVSGNKVSWNGSLDINQQQVCEYKIKALKPVNFKSKATASYFNGIETKTAEDSQAILVPNYLFKVSAALNASAINIGETDVLTISLDNVQNTDAATANLKIEIPKTANVKSKSRDFEVDGNIFTLSKAMDAGKSQDFTIEFSLEKSGEYAIPVTGTFDYTGGKKISVDERLFINGSVPSLEIKYDVDSVVLKPGEKTNIKISFKNPSSFEFRNLDAKAVTDLPGMNIPNRAFTSISPSSMVEFFNGEFKAPAVDKETTFSLSTILKYKTGYNEVFEISRDRPIVVRPGEGSNASETTQPAGAQATNETAQNPEISNISSNATTEITEETEGKKTSWKLITIIIFMAAIIILAVFIANFMKNQPQKKQTPPVKKENVFDKIKKMEAERRAKDELKKKMEAEARVKEEARKREESQRVEQQLAQKKAELKNIEKNIIQKKSAEQQQKPAEKPAEKKGFMKGLFSKTEKPKKEEQIDKSKLVKFK